MKPAEISINRPATIQGQAIMTQTRIPTSYAEFETGIILSGSRDLLRTELDLALPTRRWSDGYAIIATAALLDEIEKAAALRVEEMSGDAERLTAAVSSIRKEFNEDYLRASR